MSAPTTPGGFQRISDILAGELPALSWMVEPVFTSDVLGVIGALPKCFKSWMLADLVVAISTGSPWLGCFPVRVVGPVLMVSPEGGIRGLARRIEAILRPLGGTASDLDIAFVRTRGLSLTDRRDAGDLRAACDSEQPVLIAYDSIYAGLGDVGTSRLSEFGAALRTLSDAAFEHDAAVVTTHHLNAREGRGLHRLSGAGPGEWASAVLLGAPGSKLTIGGATSAAVTWSLTARDIPELSFTTSFSIEAQDPSDLSSPLNYGASVTLEGSGSDLGWVERRVRDAVTMLGESGGSVREINDLLATEGRPLKHETIRQALGQLLDLGFVDGLDERWWRVPGEGAVR